jgi:phosphomannomutase
MCASTVSLKMLSEIARVEGFLFEETLTGFKWIGSRAETLSREQGYLSLFCYEESLGFCCGDVVYDEDGRFVRFVVVSVSHVLFQNPCICDLDLFHLQAIDLFCLLQNV